MDLEELNMHLSSLATLNETESPIISCYINNEVGRAGYRDALDARIKEIREVVSAEQRLDFERALSRIEAFLASGLNRDATGVALFSRRGKSPFFQAFQFRLPLPNHMAVDSVPHIFELVALKDTYHRYVVLISAKSYARIVEVNVGSVTKESWTERPELRKRVGREWAKEHYQSHRRNQTQKFINEKIEMLDRLFTKEAHTHLVLAGDPRAVAQVRQHLPRRLRERVIDVVPTPGNAATADIVGATLSTYADYEQTESLGTVGLFLDELTTGGLAVAGTEATLKALARGQVDILLLSDAYAEPAAWKCRKCDAVGVSAVAEGCPRCGAPNIAPLDLKEDMTRTAEQLGCTVEIVRGSDVMLAVGGVGCLLRHNMSERRT